MNLIFDSYPLDIYSADISKTLLKSVEGEISYSHQSNASLSETLFSSFVKKASGVGLLSLIDDISIGLKGEQARRCFSNLVRKQVEKVSLNSSSLLEEAQINLMASSCVTSYLSNLESASWSNGVRNLGRVAVGLLCLENPLNVVFDSVMELSKKYDDICQVYHVAFLLNVFSANYQTKDTVKQLIAESLSNDSSGESSFFSKRRHILFSNSPYKTLQDNLKNRQNYLIEQSTKYNELYEPFVKWSSSELYK